MVNLITGGLSRALLSADSSARAATQPMNMVSREMKKRDPDAELIKRAGKYGAQEMNNADNSLKEAREELKKAQAAAKEEKKAEDKAKLEEKAAEKAAEKAEAENKVESSENVSNNTSNENVDTSVQEKPQTDTLEISPEAQLSIPHTPNIVVDIPKIYTPKLVAVTTNFSAKSKIDVSA